MDLGEPSQSREPELPSLKPSNPVSRNGVVQAILNLFENPNYLEIGVNQGNTFNALKAGTKVAVDPKFLFDHEEVAATVPGTSFWETTSDDYFGRIATPETKFDVIYLDGLHTSEQTIRDLINAISFLKGDGVVVIDDVFPCSYIASLENRNHSRILSRATVGTSSPWMGDVYRLVFFVETFCQQFSYATVNNNHGQLVLWREPREQVPQRTLPEVGAKEYKDLFLEKESFRPAPLDRILASIKEARAEKFSQADRHSPLVNFIAKAGTANVEVHDNIAILNRQGMLKQARDRCEVLSGPPPVTTLSGVIADPRYTALYDASGKIIPQSSMYVIPSNAPDEIKYKFSNSDEIKSFEPDQIDVSDVVSCKQTIVFGGAPHDHYGHHILDGMSRLWHHSDNPTLYLEALSKSRGEPGFVSQLRALGRPRESFDLRVPTLFDAVLLPHASIQNGFRIYDDADSEHLEIMESALKHVSRDVPSKVYLSRHDVKNRRCHGEKELQRRLLANGYAIVKPETLSIPDQIALFNQADWIVGAMGSAFHNLMFTSRGATTKTVQFIWKKPALRFLLVDRVKGQTSYYARTMSDESTDHKVLSTTIDVEESLTILEYIGAL